MSAKGGKLALKRRYERAASVAPFYTGGPIMVSRDGSRIACKCGGDVKLLDVASGSIVTSIPADAEDITALALSPSGQELVTSGRDMMVKTWDIAAQKKMRAWKSGHGNSFVQYLTYDDTGTLVAGGCSDAVVRVWDAARGFATHSLNGHGALITCLAFGPTPRADPNNLQLFSGAEDGEVRVWALASKSCKAVLKGHDSAVTAFALHLETRTLVTGGRDRVVGVWDLDTMSSAHSIPIFDAIEGLAIVEPAAQSASHGSAAVSKKKKGRDAQKGGAKQLDGAELRASLEVVTAGANGQLKRWCVGTGNCTKSETKRAGAVGYVSLLYAEAQAGMAHALLVAVTMEQTLLFFRPDTLEIHKQMVGYNDEVVDVVFASAEPQVLAVCTNSDHLRLFDSGSQSCRLLHGHTNVILAVDCQAALGLLATASKDRLVRVWDVKTGKCVGMGEGHVDAVGSVAWGQRTGAVCCSGSNDHSIKVWSTAKLAQEAKKASSAGNVEVDDGAGCAKMSVLRGWKAHDKDINSVAVSPNEAMLASGSQDRSVKLWHLDSGALAVTCKGHKRGVWCVKFSPVDKVVASASADATVKLWAAADGACLKTLQGHEGSVLKVVFVSSGLQLLSTASDGLLKLWTIKTCECVDSFDQHQDKVWALAAAPGDDSIVATGGADGLINVWSDTTGQLEDEARADSEQRLAMEQELSNALRAKDVRKAALLALRLEHPARLLVIVKDVLMSARPEHVLKDVAAALNAQQVAQSLGYIRDWNTTGRNSGAAQALLHAILTTWPAWQLEQMDDIKALIDALVPYTQRHLQRLEDCLQRSYLLDFTLHAMQTSLGGDDGASVLDELVPSVVDAPPKRPLGAVGGRGTREVGQRGRPEAHGEEGAEIAADDEDGDEDDDARMAAGSASARAAHARVRGETPAGDSRRREQSGDDEDDEAEEHGGDDEAATERRSAAFSDDSDVRQSESGEEEASADSKRLRPASGSAPRGSPPRKTRKQQAGGARPKRPDAEAAALAVTAEEMPSLGKVSHGASSRSKTAGKASVSLGGAKKRSASARKRRAEAEGDADGVSSGKQARKKRLSL